MITVSGLTRRFGRFTAVDDVSFRLERGEVVGFLGPNGAGKTTIMRMLTGFLPATRGSIEVAGFDVARQSLEVRRRIGYLAEAVPLYREHRVEEMLHFQARLHRLTRRAGRRRAGEVLARVGLEAKRRSLIGTLSKGQRQRVGLAVALLADPPVLILDEPTSGLDPLQRIEVRNLIRELAADRTVLLSSHILPEIEAMCPRLLILSHGRIAADGSGEELVAQLGTRAFCRVEAVLGKDAEHALRWLRAIEGVGEVVAHGALGIHQVFDVHAQHDVREDVGALAAARGWALRELSWRRPSLEELFARIALDLDDVVGGTQQVAPERAALEGPRPDAARGPGSARTLNPFISAPVSPTASVGDACPPVAAPDPPPTRSGTRGEDGGT